MKKQTILHTIQRKSSLKIGTVVAVDSNGITVKVNGNNTTMKISNGSGKTYNVGDSITLGQYNGNPQTISTLGFAGYIGANE